MPSREDLGHSRHNNKLRARILSQCKKAPRTTVALAGCALGYGVSHAVLAFAAGWLMRSLAYGQTGFVKYPIGDTIGQPITPLTYGFVGLGAAFVKAAFGSLSAYSEARFSGKVGQALRLKIADDVLAHGLGVTTPTALARLSTHVTTVETATRFGALAGLRALAQLGPLLICLIVIAPKLAMAALVTLSVFGTVVAGARRKWRGANQRAQHLAERLHVGVDELVAHGDLWRTYGAGNAIRRAVEVVGDKANRAEARVDAGRAALSGANEVLAAAALVGVVWALGRIATPLAQGPLIAFIAVFFMAYRPLRDLGDARGWLARGDAACAALEGLARTAIDAPESVRSLGHGALRFAEFGARSGGLRVSTTIAHGAMVCVRGPTGIGKTTWFRALLGLEPSTGKLHYDDVNITAAAVGPRARPFAWVPQDAPLVTASLEENITLGGGDPTLVREVLDWIGASDLLDELGATPLGPGGRGVSGGQRRLISVARALATRQPAIVLDEPTEGLDPAAAGRVMNALSALRGRRTVIIATHRAEVAALCDFEISASDSDVKIAREISGHFRTTAECPESRSAAS